MPIDQKIPAHESAVLHVTGKAMYIDDKPMHGLLHGMVYTSPHAHAKVVAYDLSGARSINGVRAVLCCHDIPGENNMGPVVHDELVLADGKVEFVGQALFLIAADNAALARKAASAIKVTYEMLPKVLTIPQAIAANELLHPQRTITCGDFDQAISDAPHVIEGQTTTGAQEHWYLETQVAMCVPGEDREMKVYSSTQHPSETQALVAEVLGVEKMEVAVEVRRMGGAFGGKETQANHTAVWAALLAQATRKPVKIRLFRDDDQKMTGKRHPFLINYKAGFDSQGRIQAMEVVLNADAGAATDLSMAVLERAMMHVDNSYFIPNMRIVGKAWKTNLPSNTAFRGFGGPQGIAGTEQAIDSIARKLGLDAAIVRLRNFYSEKGGDRTPYGQQVQNSRLHALYDQLMASSGYETRRKAIDTYNANNRYFKKGMAMTPVKFGISFTASFLNQAGALVNIYKDGSMLVNHGGTEMGQGLHTKIKQIAALEMGISPAKVKVNATDTAKVPNTSPTAASAGTDLNGMAVKAAIAKLKARMVPVAVSLLSQGHNGKPSMADDIYFADGQVQDRKNPKRKAQFSDLIMQCYLAQTSLSATGYYKTPGLHFDREKGEGNPYHYFAFGMAITEVLVDTLTGYHKILRADILHDVGDSINERIDKGQIEGAYIQGVGWCTTEECKWDQEGNLLNHSPDTYKIPGVQDIPEIFNVHLMKSVPNPGTIRKSKAVAEPPFMHGLSCWLAIKDAISAVGGHQIAPHFVLPATNEAIVLAAAAIREQTKKAQY